MLWIRITIRGNTCSFRDAIANIGVVSLILIVIQILTQP